MGLFGFEIGLDIILGIVFGLCSVYLAGRKGYNTIIGFVVGFFLGILAVFIYIVIPSNFNKRRNINVVAINVSQNQTDESDGMFFCPHCYNRVRVLKNYSTHKCPHCNEMFVI